MTGALKAVTISGENAFQLFKQVRAPQPIGLLHIPPFDLVAEEGFKFGDIVELAGANGSGKSELIYNMVATCICPSHWAGVELGGKSLGVIYIDLDGRFSVLRLVALLEGRFQRHFIPILKLNNDSILSSRDFILNCLGRLHVTQCFNTDSWLATLQLLPELLSQVAGIRVLVIDDVAAFYWLDKGEGGDYTHQTAYQTRAVDLIKNLSYNHNLVVFTTKPYMYLSKGPSIIPPKEYLNRAWQKAVTYRYHLFQEAPCSVFNTTRLLSRSSIPLNELRCLPGHVFAITPLYPVKLSSFYWVITQGGSVFL